MSDRDLSPKPNPAMPLDALTAAAAGAGWDFFAEHVVPGAADTTRRMWTEKLEADASDRAMIFARVFDTPEGRVVLEHLCDLTLRRPTFIALVNLPMHQAYGIGCHREGQNAIVHTILKLIAEGRQEAPPVRETT